MTDDAQELLDRALSLPEPERAELATRLLESLESPFDPGVEEAWTQEIARRIAEIDAGKVEMIPWERAKELIFGAADES